MTDIAVVLVLLLVLNVCVWELVLRTNERRRR